MNLRLRRTLTVVRRPETLPDAQCLVKTVCVHLVEIYFSVVQRKVLTPNDFTSTDEVADRILRFQRHYERAARPFQWKFTHADLQKLMLRLKNHSTSSEPLRLRCARRK